MEEKKAKPNTLISKRAKRASPGAGIEMRFGFKNIPVPRSVIERWKEELRAYPIKYPEAKTLIRLYHSLGYSEDSYRRMVEKYPDLKEEHEKCLEALGHRLWEKSVDFKANWVPLKFMIHNFGKSFAQAKALEKENNENQQGIVVMQMPAIPKPDETK